MAHTLHSCAREKLGRLGPRRPMSDRRRQFLCRPALPERPSWHARSSLHSRHHPARAIVPSRGLFFYSEVQCLDVVSTESRSPAHRAVSLAARGTSTKPASSVPSSTLRCVIAADAASIAPSHWRSTSRRSITCTRSRTEGHTLLAISSRHVRHVIDSRATCFPTNSSADIRGPERISCGTRAPCTVH